MKLHSDDGPFTKARLINIARYYYPSMEYAESRASSSEEITRIERSTPQWQARSAAYDSAMANRDSWRALVQTLEAALPDYYVADATKSYLLEPAYVVALEPRDQSREGRLLGMVSVLAPLYFIGEVVGERRFRDPIDDEFQTVAELLKREMLARYPYHRLEHNVALTIVPGLQTGYLQYGETTLIDLLMTSRWGT